MFDKGGVDSRFATDGAKSIMNVYYSQQFGKPTKGIKLQVAAAPGNEHFQLGAAERKSQSVARKCTAAILRAETDSSFKPQNWGYAMLNSIDMINLTPTKRDDYRKSPYTKVTGQEIDLHKILLLPFWENCVATQDRQLHANEVGTKLTTAGVNVKYVRYKEGGKKVKKIKTKQRTEKEKRLSTAEGQGNFGSAHFSRDGLCTEGEAG